VFLALYLEKRCFPQAAYAGIILISMTVHYESVICHSSGSHPSEVHCGGWEGLGKDGEEPALPFLIT